MENKTLIGGAFAMLLLGFVRAGASSYYSTYEPHKRMMASDDFEGMHTAMMNGDFMAAEKYHETLGFECPMYNLVKEEDISLKDFRIMHEWMLSGNIPKEKPEGISDAT